MSLWQHFSYVLSRFIRFPTFTCAVTVCPRYHSGRCCCCVITIPVFSATKSTVIYAYTHWSPYPPPSHIIITIIILSNMYRWNLYIFFIFKSSLHIFPTCMSVLHIQHHARCNVTLCLHAYSIMLLLYWVDVLHCNIVSGSSFLTYYYSLDCNNFVHL